MAYSLIIEGKPGTRRVREGHLPRRGDWLTLVLGDASWWFPVLEVGHVVTEGEPAGPIDVDFEFVHEQAEAIVFTSSALGVRVGGIEGLMSYKIAFPPPRWPMGGVDPRAERHEGEDDGGREEEDDGRA